jgi:hypothetical protein
MDRPQIPLAGTQRKAIFKLEGQNLEAERQRGTAHQEDTSSCVRCAI